MSLSEVNSTLGIAPFDMFISDEGYAIFSYNYRLKMRRIPIDNNETFMDRPGDPANKSINSEEAQKFGTDFYEEEKKLFVSLKDDKMVSLITEDGLQKASQIMAISGSFSQLKNDPQFKVLPDLLLQNNVVVPLDDKGNYIPNNGGGATGAGVGFPVWYMGNNIGISALPSTQPREIKGGRIPRKASVNFFKNKKKRNKGSEVMYQSDF
jgi:hypothetical protein